MNDFEGGTITAPPVEAAKVESPFAKIVQGVGEGTIDPDAALKNFAAGNLAGVDTLRNINEPPPYEPTASERADGETVTPSGNSPSPSPTSEGFTWDQTIAPEPAAPVIPPPTESFTTTNETQVAEAPESPTYPPPPTVDISTPSVEPAPLNAESSPTPEVKAEAAQKLIDLLEELKNNPGSINDILDTLKNH